jgi:O-antigen/teichoic acid export membrane protein
VFNLKDYKVENYFGITRKMFNFGIMVTLTGFGGKIIGYIGTLLLTYFLTLTEVGIYNVVLPTALMALFIGKSVILVFFPMVSEMFAKKENRLITLGINKLSHYTFVLVTPFLLALIIYAKDFIQLLFGAEYLSGTLALQIVVVGTLFYLVSTIYTGTLSAIGQPKEVTKIILIAAMINIVINLIVIPIYGISGAAFATTISYLFVYFTSKYKIGNIFQSKLGFSFWLKLIICNTAFLLILITMKKVNFMNVYIDASISGGLSLLLYLLLAYMFNLIDIKEINIKKIFNK